MEQSFFGVLPLYIGVEITLGITILNKCSGGYGILAVFTGHPLDLMQWMSYLWSVGTLAVYAQGLYQIHKPRVYTFAQILVTFTVDTVVSCLFTLWFTGVWFSTGTDESPVAKRGEGQASQGASEGYEYMITIIITLTSLLFRFYYNYILASFVQELLRTPKFLVDQDDVAQDLKNKNAVARAWIKSQRVSYHWCRRLLL